MDWDSQLISATSSNQLKVTFLVSATELWFIILFDLPGYRKPVEAVITASSLFDFNCIAMSSLMVPRKF